MKFYFYEKLTFFQTFFENQNLIEELYLAQTHFDFTTLGSNLLGSTVPATKK